MNRIVGRTIASLAFASTTAGAHATSITFIDGTVNPAGYATSIYNSDPSVGIAVTAISSGNPGAALQIRYTNAGAMVNMQSTLGFINTGFAYNPSSQGAINRVEFSNDRYVDVGAALNPLITVFSRSLLLQNGKYYVAAYADPAMRGAWYTSAAPGPLTSTDYTLFDFVTGLSDPLQHPDFSSSGSLLDFGFASRFNLTTAGPFALDGVFAFDNLSIRINGVPEPSQVAMIFLGLAALGATIHRRPPKSARRAA